MSIRFDIILTEQLNALLEESSGEVRRHLQLQHFPRKASVITGIRRAGKSTFLRQHLRKISKTPLFYLSFFDERLIGLNIKDLNEALVAFGSIHDGHEPRQFLLDEIQVLDGWENFVARLIENPRNEVFLTGSSAKLLSKEVATELRGRAISYELFPFSWLEYLEFHKIDKKNVTSSKLGKLKKLFIEYLKWGGFPEVVSAPLNLKQKIIKEYFEVLLFRDLVERNSFSHVNVARKLLVTLVRMYSNRFTINQTHKKLRAEGINVDKGTLSNFIQWCQDAYILFPVKLWTSSEHRARTNPQKIYLSDLGLTQSSETWSEQNMGRRFENACFIHLRSHPQFSTINYYITKSGGEVDFILENLSGEKKFYQICWELNHESREREINALEEAMSELNLNHGTLVTLNQAETIKVKSGKIQVISFDQFLATR